MTRQLSLPPLVLSAAHWWLSTLLILATRGVFLSPWLMEMNPYYCCQMLWLKPLLLIQRRPWNLLQVQLQVDWPRSGSGTFWLNLNLKYQVRSSGQPNPEPEPLELGLKGSNSVLTSSNLQLNKPNFSFFYLFSFGVFSWCHTVTKPNWLAYIFISSQPALSFHSHSHTTSKVIVFITN